MSTVNVKRILIFFALLKVIFADVEPGDSCTTPSTAPGVCTLFRKCQFLYGQTKQGPMSQKVQSLIENSICKRDGTKTFVCCPVASQKKPPKVLEENSTCQTPDNKRGSCQRFLSCKPLHKKYQEEPDNENLKAFIRNSVCFKKVRALYVCCSDEDMEPEPETTTQVTTTEETAEEEPVPVWLGQLRQKVPKAPNCGCDVQDRIIGGEVTDITDFPWTVLLEYENVSTHEMSFKCGGSLISDRYVLTAAHCVESRNMEELKLANVVIGEWNLRTEIDCDDDDNCLPSPITNEVVKTIVHENYRMSATNKHDDIALLRLADHVEFTDFVSPICLPLDPAQWNKDYRGLKFSAAGFGKTELNKTSDKKLKVELPYRSFGDCKDLYRRKGIKLSRVNHICAGSMGRDTCKGDSGGSLMYYDVEGTVPYWHVAGVVSFGAADCGQELPGVYTNITNYLEWINDNIELEESGQHF